MDSKRYDKQIALPEIGILGQKRLADAKVLVIGAGGLGCPVLQSLAAAGVGCLGIVDGDRIEESNLHRQFLFSNADCGKQKSIVAAAVLSKQNPEVKTIVFDIHFTIANAAQIVSDFQIIVDCTDNIAARYLINDISMASGIPMVYASIHRFEGQISVFNFDGGPSYRCLFPKKEMLADNCSNLGVLGVLPNTIGVLQATEVLKIILGIGEVLSGKLMLFNALQAKIQTIAFERNEAEIEIGRQNGLAILNQKSHTATSIDSIEFLKAIEKNTHLVIDLRERYEEPKLDFENIENIPPDALERQLENTAKDQQIILFCQRGNNSLHAANYLIRLGFGNVSHLQNGINSLENQTTFKQ